MCMGRIGHYVFFGGGVAFSSPKSFFGNLTKLRTAGRSQEEEEEEEEEVVEEERKEGSIDV